MPTQEKIDKLRKQLMRWDKYYHNSGSPLVSDEEYDAAVDVLRKWSPDDLFFNKVGAPIATGKKVKLPYPMPSLGKVRVDKGVERWLKESSGRIAALDKLDGSASAVIQDSVTVQTFYSRGDGSVGQNITPLLKHVSGIPKKFGAKEAVRGELVMHNQDFAKWKDKFANTRNLVNGAVNSSKAVPAYAKDIRFIAHELLNPKLSWDKARVKLKAEGFDTAVTKIFTNPTPQELTDYLKDRRAKSTVELDGLVLIDLKTGDKISFKVDEVAVKAIVDHVEWNISPNKLYKPTVVLKESIIIKGVKVQRASGHNAAYILSHGIGPGAIIKIIRSGDVIPKVVGVTKKVNPQLPDNFVWNKNKVEAVATKLTKQEESTVYAKRLVNALVVLGIEGIRIGQAAKLVRGGIRDISDLWSVSKRTLTLSDIGDVATNKLYSSIQSMKERVTHAELMDASGIWPKGYTITRFTLILDKIPFKELIERYKDNKVKLRDDIADIQQMSRISATEFLRGLAPYTRMLKTIGSVPRKDTNSTKPKTSLLSGKQYVFTGVRSKAVEKFITDNGGIVSGSINKNTTALIVLDKNSNSIKTDKADALKVPRVPLDQFVKQYKIKV